MSTGTRFSRLQGEGVVNATAFVSLRISRFLSKRAERTIVLSHRALEKKWGIAFIFLEFGPLHASKKRTKKSSSFIVN